MLELTLKQSIQRWEYEGGSVLPIQSSATDPKKIDKAAPFHGGESGTAYRLVQKPDRTDTRMRATH
ncbi:MAG: hypothetical protein ACO1QB_14315 [Verrucomicrobiales bacterium]